MRYGLFTTNFCHLRHTCWSHTPECREAFGRGVRRDILGLSTRNRLMLFGTLCSDEILLSSAVA